MWFYSSLAAANLVHVRLTENEVISCGKCKRGWKWEIQNDKNRLTYKIKQNHIINNNNNDNHNHLHTSD